MASFEFHNVKAEKEDALWRYNMERKLRIGLRLIGFLSVLLLLSWSWFPTLIPDSVEVAGDFRRCLVSTFNRPLFTFILVNVIILAVYVLSSQNQTQQQTTSSRCDIYDEYVSSLQNIPTSATATAAFAMEKTMVDKQIVLVQNAVALISPAKQQRTSSCETVTETKSSLSPVEQQPMEIGTPTKTKPALSSTKVNQKEYRRTRSTVSESQNQGRREFRRSETAMISRELVISGAEPPRSSFDEMSNEEFRLKIDSFIAEKKRTLMQENTAHYTRTKEKYLPIVVKN